MSSPFNFEVYFDFDNTITDFDVLDDIIRCFSINEDWKTIEEDWESGKIGSRECLDQQLAQVRITGEVLLEYLGKIKIDPAFRAIQNLLRDKKIEPFIVSDSFDLIIRTILENNGYKGLTILANEMRIEGNKPIISFPYFHSICSTCANCKTSHLFRRNRPNPTKKIYVGDGKSDICPAGFCEILLAKGTLYKHYATLHKDCRPFENLGTVLSYLTNLLI